MKTSVVVASIAALAVSAACAQAATVRPPVIKEVFTPLPCPTKTKTTLDSEGCTEKVILHQDEQIDRLAASVFSLLKPRDRKGFVLKFH